MRKIRSEARDILVAWIKEIIKKESVIADAKK